MNGWDEFAEFMLQAKARMEDRWAPIALICLQATPSEDGVVDVQPWNDGAIIWPAGFPVSERGSLLERLSKPYRDGTVLRGEGR